MTEHDFTVSERYMRQLFDRNGHTCCLIPEDEYRRLAIEQPAIRQTQDEHTATLRQHGEALQEILRRLPA